VEREAGPVAFDDGRALMLAVGDGEKAVRGFYQLTPAGVTRLPVPAITLADLDGTADRLVGRVPDAAPSAGPRLVVSTDLARAWYSFEPR
jgi:hypothetical protein